MVHLGERLGLFRALAAAPEGGYTSHELADAAGLHERWVREWARNQAAAQLLEWEEDADGVERFSMTPESVAVLADADHPANGSGMFYRLPQTMHVLEELAESFRTGIGLDYDAFGPKARQASSAASDRGTATSSFRWACRRSTEWSSGWTREDSGGHRLWRRNRGHDDGRRVPPIDVPRIRHLEHALDRAERSRSERGLDNVSSTTLESTRSPRTARSISSLLSTASTT